MRFLYIDKANSIDDIRIAEKTIWAYEMPKNGHSVDFLLLSTKLEENDTYNSINEVDIINYPKSLFLSLISFVFKLPIKLLRNRPDFIVVRNVVDLGILSYMFSKLFRVKLIYIKAFPYLEMKCKNKKGVQKFLLKKTLDLEIFLMKQVDYLIIRSLEFKKQLENNYNIKRDSIIIPMGFDAEYIYKIDASDKIKIKNNLGLNKEFTAIYFGAIDKSRRIDFLLDILQEVKSEKNNLDFLIVGGNQKEVSLLKYECKQKGLDIILIPSIDRCELFKIIQVCDFSISPIPPINEYILSSPTKVIESLGLGCPVIVNGEIIDQREIAANSGGGIIVDYNANEFKEEIINILDHKYDLKKMSQTGKEYILLKRTYEQMAKDIISVLKE